jgi:hypothetical protein
MQDITADRSAREALIRDMYSIVAFFVANPDIPVPWAMTINVHVETAEQLRELAARLDVHVYGLAQDQTDYNIPGTTTPVGLIISSRERATGGPE